MLIKGSQSTIVTPEEASRMRETAKLKALASKNRWKVGKVNMTEAEYIDYIRTSDYHTEGNNLFGVLGEFRMSAAGKRYLEHIEKA